MALPWFEKATRRTHPSHLCVAGLGNHLLSQRPSLVPKFKAAVGGLRWCRNLFGRNILLFLNCFFWVRDFFCWSTWCPIFFPNPSTPKDPLDQGWMLFEMKWFWFNKCLAVCGIRILVWWEKGDLLSIADMQIHLYLAARRDAVGFSRAGPRTYPDLKVHFQTLDLAGSPRLACKWCHNDMQSWWVEHRCSCTLVVLSLPAFRLYLNESQLDIRVSFWLAHCICMHLDGHRLDEFKWPNPTCFSSS